MNETLKHPYSWVPYTLWEEGMIKPGEHAYLLPLSLHYELWTSNYHHSWSLTSILHLLPHHPSVRGITLVLLPRSLFGSLVSLEHAVCALIFSLHWYWLTLKVRQSRQV